MLYEAPLKASLRGRASRAPSQQRPWSSWAGVAWIVAPPAPLWWPLAQAWWLPGGAVVGASQLASAVIALALLGYSYRRFRGTSASLNTSTDAVVGVIAGAGPPTPTGSPVSHAATVLPDCVKGERHELPCRCLCASAA